MTNAPKEEAQKRRSEEEGEEKEEERDANGPRGSTSNQSHPKVRKVKKITRTALNFLHLGSFNDGVGLFQVRPCHGFIVKGAGVLVGVSVK